MNITEDLLKKKDNNNYLRLKEEKENENGSNRGNCSFTSKSDSSSINNSCKNLKKIKLLNFDEDNFDSFNANVNSKVNLSKKESNKLEKMDNIETEEIAISNIKIPIDLRVLRSSQTKKV